MEIVEVTVSFDENGKEYSFNGGELNIHAGNKVMVETTRGIEIGTITAIIEKSKPRHELKPIVRLATKEDVEQKEENLVRQEEIRETCQTLADNLKLDMKTIKAELVFDRSKVIIFFTADDRVDFRELVKQLAGKYKMRIELKQVDAREETKLIGGLGPCGKECCCHQFLRDAEHSTIKMAKIQGLSLNPTNISGLCGKLKCCLAYENEHYSETFKLMPKINTEVITPEGKGLVVYNNLLKQMVSVKFLTDDGSNNIKEFTLKDIKRINGDKYAKD